MIDRLSVYVRSGSPCTAGPLRVIEASPSSLASPPFNSFYSPPPLTPVILHCSKVWFWCHLSPCCTLVECFWWSGRGSWAALSAATLCSAPVP